MIKRIKKSFGNYPNPFKILILSTFIDRLGGFLLYPFFALYITAKFNVGMTEVGFLFSIFSFGNILGGIIGGALSDKYGRRMILLIGLISSGLGSIFMGIVDDLVLFFFIASFLGIFGNLGAPARQAMVVDLLPEEKQAGGFGILRVSVNLSATIGPILGGLLANQSYMFLFISDAASSLITALIVFLVIPETKPKSLDHQIDDSVIKTIKGYKEVFKDYIFMLFLLVSIIMVLVYLQLNSTLSVFLRDEHGFSEQNFGFLLATNAAMVVILQIPIAKWISKYKPMIMMAIGTLFYMIGFGMYGFIAEVYLFFIAMIILTIGEIIVSPISQAAVGHLSPIDKRGRYMAMFGFSWAIPSTFGVILAGLVMDNIGPNWVWYFAGILSLISIIGFLLLHKPIEKRYLEIKSKKEKKIEIQTMN
ncbi:MAG: MFS transporter [Candidatus Lokiarchaeota archaeon]|nr:MFS transporter [Candidatus Lokiarchaeota archaeon]MBD3199804.1 MFS transporter [Candidatus Lokiarchaeota archaeon]